MATRARELGYLVIADISGYTSFLTRTELEHAHGIVAELTALVIARLGAPLRFVELEGDAVFAYAPAAAFADPERLLDMIEACYVAFQPLRGRDARARARARRARPGQDPARRLGHPAAIPRALRRAGARSGRGRPGVADRALTHRSFTPYFSSVSSRS